MSIHARRDKILNLLRAHPGLRVTELAAALGVSEGTVRNHLTTLEQEGVLLRYHGGAILTEPRAHTAASFATRHEAQAAEKKAIGAAAARQIADGDSLLLDASSSAYYLALALESRQRLRVVTNGLDIARVLAQTPSNSVVLLGGILSSDGSSVTGLFSEQMIGDLHVQKAFVSCSGLSLERGLTEVHLAEAQLKHKVLQSAREVIALVTSDKFGQEDLTAFARLDQIHHLYTDDRLTPEWAERLRTVGLPVTVCPTPANTTDRP